METIFKQAIKSVALAIGIDRDELKSFFRKGETVVYGAGDWVYHESTPRLWAGIVLEGEVEILRGLHGPRQRVVVLDPGALIAEGALLDELPHATSALTRQGAKLWQISRERLELLRVQQPEVFYRIVARVARRIAERLRAGDPGPAEDLPRVGGVRREHDSLGERELPDTVYYGVQTARALENFQISGVPLRNFGHFIDGLALVKKAAAMANHELGVLAADRMKAIGAACDEILAGKLHAHFVVDMFQGGAGTSTNMNANEVIANKALEILGHPKGSYDVVHPNNHVNCSQSTNDAYPTALRVALLLIIPELMEAMRGLSAAFREKAGEFKDVIKMGRTQLQDAVPMTLGQEFGAFATTIAEDIDRLETVKTLFHEVNLGATAIGTGINAPPGYAPVAVAHLRRITGMPLQTSTDLIEATWDTGAYVQLSGLLRRLAVKLSKICNDLRLLSSGPRAGFNEIDLPRMQPGSSIMPGKVNPVIPEVVNQIAFQVIGLDLTVTLASEAGQLQLNVMEPVIAFDLFQMLEMLQRGCRVLEEKCVRGITANRERCREMVMNSIGIVTALNPVIGYEASASIAKEALESGRPVYEIALERGLIDQAKLERIFSLENLMNPKFFRK